ncbi:hypothetical protein LOD99_8644 [Oopsacas minuta]|uniref:Amine oxidase domain-containing protein n=1 Tax=Oopsacas minuta TaxID=111878 RepID=A0AAV7JGU5_9METZ|nr:hypothetical protein LOD99_8644 [Oopsacas minuta]
MANTKFSPYVDSVISECLTKINLYFKKQWWSILGIDSGPNYTDLQLGTVYIFNPIKEPAERLKAYEDPGSLTIYCDYDNSYYWQSMQSIGQDYQPKDNVKVPLHSVLAKEQVVAVAMDQLAQLFQRSNFKKGSPRDVTPMEPLIEIPDPVLATYTHWTDPRFGDSCHAWKVFSNDSIDSPGMFNVLGPNIGIIGESYSLVQAWVDGSLTETNSYLEYLTKSGDF